MKRRVGLRIRMSAGVVWKFLRRLVYKQRKSVCSWKYVNRIQGVKKAKAGLNLCGLLWPGGCGDVTSMKVCKAKINLQGNEQRSDFVGGSRKNTTGWISSKKLPLRISPLKKPSSRQIFPKWNPPQQYFTPRWNPSRTNWPRNFQPTEFYPPLPKTVIMFCIIFYSL